MKNWGSCRQELCRSDPSQDFMFLIAWISLWCGDRQGNSSHWVGAGAFRVRRKRRREGMVCVPDGCHVSLLFHFHEEWRLGSPGPVLITLARNCFLNGLFSFFFPLWPLTSGFLDRQKQDKYLNTLLVWHVRHLWMGLSAAVRAVSAFLFEQYGAVCEVCSWTSSKPTSGAGKELFWCI